jgi:cytochrome c-type biogenesis protein CcmH
MTARLEATVKAQPEGAEAWYFLGRAYMSQSLFAQAVEAFQKAADLANRPPEVLGQLAQAQFFSGDRTWTPALQALTDEALKANPQENTSLGLLGIAAFESARYADAISYWQRLLDAMPPEDAAREQILSGIERAKSNLLASGGTLPEPVVANAAAPVRVRVDLAPGLRDKVQPGDTLFVFAKAASGPPMPLAVKRLTVADLPVEVSLSDADAMMPQLKISGFAQIQLMARISRAGNATAGEWVGRSQAIASNSAELQQITIDSPDKP